MRHLLLVEDNETFRRTLEVFLESIGYATFAVSDRETAVKHLDTDWDAVVFDYISPCSVPAADFVARIRASEANKCTPVILITAFHSVPEQLDVQAVLHKPFDVLLLQQALREARSRIPAEG